MRSDRGQRSSSGWGLEDGFGGRMDRSRIEIEGPVIGVLTVGTLKARDRTLCRVLLVQR